MQSPYTTPHYYPSTGSGVYTMNQMNSKDQAVGFMNGPNGEASNIPVLWPSFTANPVTIPSSVTGPNVYNATQILTSGVIVLQDIHGKDYIVQYTP